jgi:hypothetical protein
VPGKPHRRLRAKLSEQELRDSLRVESGALRDARITLYAIVRDEMFFLPAFFDHYRRLGVEQFLVLDDGSTDGTRAFLESQTNCVVLSSELSFGDRIAVVGEAGERTGRAGQFLKEAIPRRFLMERYAVYVDADEFLILPSGVPGLSALVECLSERGIESVAASLVDFFPSSREGLDRKLEPRSFADLVDAYPCFDGLPLLSIAPGRQPRRANPTASRRLFLRFGIKEPPPALAFLPDALVARLPFQLPHCPWMKTPLVRWSERVRLTDSHRVSFPPPHDRVLAIAHFKFTCDLARRAEAAMERRAHARGSRKYFQYHRLLRKLREAGDGVDLAGPDTRYFRAPISLEAAGLVVWPR